MTSSFDADPIAETRSQRPRPLLTEHLGRTAWTFVGCAVVAAIVYRALAEVAGIVVPLVIAAVAGIVLVPLVDVLERSGIPRALASALVTASLVAVGVAVVWITIIGVVDQASEISLGITEGLGEIEDWLARHLDDVTLDRIDTSLDPWTGSALKGLASSFGSVFASATAFLAGAAISVFLLYFVLRDWLLLRRWVGEHLGLPADVGAGIVNDATLSVSRYFGGLTISSAITAVLTGVTAALLDVPLAFTIAIVTLATSYVPYIGAIFSGAFAVLIALGSQGITTALILLMVILVVQNVVQTVVLTKLTSDLLRLHPIVSFGSTIVGAALFGLLGAMLSAPAVAIIVSTYRRLRDLDEEPAVAST